MNKRGTGVPSPGEELRHFTNREDEKAVLGPDHTERAKLVSKPQEA